MGIGKTHERERERERELWTKRLLLRPLRIEDITPEYLQWLNSPEITQYLEIRHTPQTYDMVCEYLTKRLQKPECPHFGIFDKGGQRHVGSVTLNALNPVHKTADISFVIGYPGLHGKGYATEAVHMMCNHAFTCLGLAKVTGGHYAGNIGSQKVFLHNSFRQEAVLRKQVINIHGDREDIIRYGLLAEEFQR